MNNNERGETPNDYGELNQIIKDFVGYLEDDNDPYEGPCADPVLFDNITSECNMHIRDNVPLDMLSKDAQWCITEWESLMKNYRLYEERSV